jgi:hypothetical protein
MHHAHNAGFVLFVILVLFIGFALIGKGNRS